MTELPDGWADDEIMRLTSPAGMPGSPAGLRADYSAAAYDRELNLTQGPPAPAPELTPDEGILKFARMLADRRGQSVQQVLDQAAELTSGNSEDEKAEALLLLSDMSDEDAIALSVLTQAEREKPSAHTIPGSTDYPIPDKGHLQAAIARFKQGKLAGHSRKEVKAHILKHARRLGVEVDLGGDDDDDDDDGDDREDRRDRSRDRRPRKQPKQPGGTNFRFHNDGTDSFHAGGGAGGFDTGGPSGQGEGGGMAASQQQMVQHLVRSARPAGGYAASEVLRLTAARVDDPEQHLILTQAAEIVELREDQRMSAEESEVARLTREYYPHEFGLARSEAAGGSPELAEVDAILARAKAAGIGPEGKKASGKKAPVGKKVTTRTRAHVPDEEDCSTDPEAEVARYLRAVRKNFSPDQPYGSVQSYGSRQMR
jgi:hypothetical protein